MGYRSVKDENLSEIAKNIKKLRESKNETQNDLAKKINISKDALARIEQGVNNLTLENAKAIANHYKVSIDWICDRSKDMNAPDNFLSALTKYLNFEMRSVGIGFDETVYNFLSLSINPHLNTYLKNMLRAEQLKKDNVPDDVLNVWLDKEKQNFIDSYKDDSKPDYYALISNDDLLKEVMKILDDSVK